MKEIRVSLKEFDLDGFIAKVLNFLKAQVLEGLDPSCATYWVESPGHSLQDEGDEGWDFRRMLVNDRVFVFFPFAIPDFKGSFECADANSYRVPAEDEDEDDDQCSVEEDVVGYFVRVRDGVISIASAICPLSGSIPPATIDLLPDCKELEQPMLDFIHGFMK